VTRESQREHPCLSTGKTSGACPGYRKDHVQPLACGGPDAVWNLQWQTIAAAKAKDHWERRACGRGYNDRRAAITDQIRGPGLYALTSNRFIFASPVKPSARPTVFNHTDIEVLAAQVFAADHYA
jgi:hypothetical protein